MITQIIPYGVCGTEWVTNYDILNASADPRIKVHIYRIDGHKVKTFNLNIEHMQHHIVTNESIIDYIPSEDFGRHTLVLESSSKDVFITAILMSTQNNFGSINEGKQLSGELKN